MTTELTETILSNLGGIEHNNLISILDIETNEFIQMPPSLYFEVDELKTLRKATGSNKQVSILSMKIQSIHSLAARGGNLAKIPPNQVIADFGRGSSVESESE